VVDEMKNAVPRRANNPDFQVIVVGGGPAGLTCAYTLAKAGVEVAIIERGNFPGAKNVMGGVLYRVPTEKAIPDFWKSAPLERFIIEQQYWIATKDSNLAITYRSDKFSNQPYNRFTVLRAKFDSWFAKQVVEAGACLINKTVVEDVIALGDKIVGISTDRPDGDLYAKAVVLADGVNSILTEKAGLRKKIDTEDVALAVKEILALPRQTIQERFNLEGDQGATIDIYGQIVKGMEGTAFIYTNKESLSIGVGAILADLVENKIRPYELLDKVKEHPVIKPLVSGGSAREYLAHMIPEGGYKAMPRLYADGVLVAGDAAMMVNGFHREGSNLAMTAGRLAGETLIKASQQNDYSATFLSQYKILLEDSFVLQDLKKYRNLPGFIASRPEFFSVYPQLISDATYEFLTVDGKSKKEKQRQIWRHTTQKRSKWRILSDIYRSWRAFG
jgi:electron transfer flavoprotein-quinone oxidoreductase